MENGPKAFRRIRLNLLPPEVKRSLVARNVRESRTFSRNPGISLYDRWGSAHPIPVQRPSGPADRPKTGLQEEGRRKREKEGKREKEELGKKCNESIIPLIACPFQFFLAIFCG
ncbi:hypothetical protein CEXT_438081 [Caerostris extrusa]|uniref:Uncharacterized protein n=1 Tax=Caerostris extrusa TaxID=172846 RepID=A0AAV4MBP9_CAEEX|nr:hypothetical protein CEXT_438081 [Caerostris extrusa]